MKKKPWSQANWKTWSKADGSPHSSVKRFCYDGHISTTGLYYEPCARYGRKVINLLHVSINDSIWFYKCIRFPLEYTNRLSIKDDEYMALDSRTYTIVEYSNWTISMIHPTQISPLICGYVTTEAGRRNCSPQRLATIGQQLVHMQFCWIRSIIYEPVLDYKNDNYAG